MLSPSSSTRSAVSRLMSRRTLLLGGAVSLMAGCASDIRPLSEEAKAKVGSPTPSASATASASSSPSASQSASAPHQQALRATRLARHAYPYLRMRSLRVGKSTPVP